MRMQGPSYALQTLERRLDYQTNVLRMFVSRQLSKVFFERYRYEAMKDAWLVAEAQYRPLPWSGRATLFRAREESAAFALWTAVEVDDTLGWRRYLERGVEIVMCPGDHVTMCEEPNARFLAQKLREAIERACPPAADTTRLRYDGAFAGPP
jgi:thioesterase domain-containing protein